MGCGASQNVTDPGKRSKRRSTSQGLSELSDGSDSDSDEKALPSYATPFTDKLWRIKTLFFDSAQQDKNLTIDVFVQRSNIEVREIYRALDIFDKISAG